MYVLPNWNLTPLSVFLAGGVDSTPSPHTAGINMPSLIGLTHKNKRVEGVLDPISWGQYFFGVKIEDFHQIFNSKHNSNLESCIVNVFSFDQLGQNSKSQNLVFGQKLITKMGFSPTKQNKILGNPPFWPWQGQRK